MISVRAVVRCDYPECEESFGSIAKLGFGHEPPRIMYLHPGWVTAVGVHYCEEHSEALKLGAAKFREKHK